jgi:hypothetical protein
MPDMCSARFIVSSLTAAALALTASLALAQAQPQATPRPQPRALFLVQPFDGAPLSVSALDVAGNGEILLTALPAEGSSADPGIRVARFDAAGRKLWERNPAPRSEFVSTALARAAGADHTLVLHDETPKDQSQLVLVRLDGKGQTLWRRELGPGAASDLAVDGDAGALISGSVPREKTGGIDALVMRVTADGAPVWRRRFSGERKDSGNSADLLRLAGQTILVGGLADILYDKPDETVVASRGMAMRLQQDGQPAWRQFFGEDPSLSMVGGLAVGALGDAYVLALTETPATSAQFVELVRLRADGGIGWRRPLAGPASQEINDMTVLPDGSLALVGSELQSQDQRAAILLLLDSEGIERTRVNYRGYKMRRALMVKPHPAGGFAILFEGPAGSGFDVTNYLGRVDAQGRF